VSAFFPDVARGAAQAARSGWLPGSLTLVVLTLAVLLLVHREAFRGVLTAEREQRVRGTRVVVVPLVLCAVLTLGARLVELLT
jgi:hypothetical protein